MSCNDQAPPPSRLPDVTHMTLSPRPSPSVLHTASNQKLEAGTAWERGHSRPMSLSIVLLHHLSTETHFQLLCLVGDQA